MSTLDDEVKVEGVYGGVQSEVTASSETTTTSTTGTTETVTASSANLPVTRSFWSNMKAFWLQEIDLKKIDWKREIKVELTPYQQKIENEINEFLHQDITWAKVRDFITKPFSSKTKNNL